MLSDENTQNIKQNVFAFCFFFCSTVKKLVIILEKYQKIWYNIIDYNRLP